MSRESSAAQEHHRVPMRNIAALSIFAAIAILGFVFAQVNRSRQEQRDVDAGRKLVQAGRLADAESTWKSVLRADPANTAAWELLAKLYIGTHHYEQAIDPLRQLARLKPETPGVYAQLAECLRRTGNQEGALEQAREALKHNPNDISALTTAALALNTLDEGTQELVYERRLAQLKPDDPDFLRMFAGELVRYGSYSEALPVLDTLLQIAPNDPNGFSLRGEARYYLDQTPQGLAKAQADLQHALQLAPNAYVPNLYLGRISLRLNRPKQAISYLLQAKRSMPSRDDADFSLAEAYELTGQRAQAERARSSFLSWREETDQENQLQKRLALNPGSFEDNLMLGRIKLHKRDLDAAQYYLARALQLQPTSAEARAALQQLETPVKAAGALPSLPSGEH